MKTTIIIFALVSSLTISGVAHAGKYDKTLKSVFGAGKAATSFAKTSPKVVGVQAGRASTQAGSFSRQFNSSSSSLKTNFSNANQARSYQSPMRDSLGNLHSGTTKLANNPGYAGFRFESRQLVTPTGQKYKTTNIIDSKSAIIAPQSGKGYLTGNANTRFGKQ